MDKLNDDENNFPNKAQPSDETLPQNTEDLKAENSQKMQEKRAEREEKDSKSDDLLLAIDGAKVKFNAHLGEFKVLNDVPTTQDKLTGTIVEKKPLNFTFYDGFTLASLTEWQDFGTVQVQDNDVLLKKSTLPGTGKMPGNIPPETGKIEFVTSGQINEPESIDAVGAPLPEQKNIKVDFVVFPRVWMDNPWMLNYNLDWNRENDDKFFIRSKNHSEIFDNCILGKDAFTNFYNETKILVNNTEYSPPYLRMFKNHNVVTGHDVILSLYVTFDDIKKIASEKILIEYDNSIFDVGFTDDGKTINNKEFIIEKKYFHEDYYSLNDNAEERKTKYEIAVTNSKDEKLLVINKLIIKCRETFSENQQIKFLNSKKEVVGVLTVRPNTSFIFSKRKFKYVKIKRKSYKDQDISTIKKLLTSTYIQD
jgi:hypothetical protein